MFKLDLANLQDEPMPAEMNSFKNAIMERRASNKDYQRAKPSLELRVDTEPETFGVRDKVTPTETFSKAANQLV